MLVLVFLMVFGVVDGDGGGVNGVCVDDFVALGAAGIVGVSVVVFGVVCSH